MSWENEIQYTQLHEVMKHAVLGNIATFGILGNHDYGFNWSEADVAMNICDIMKNSGIQMLNNAQTEISGLNFIGFEDLWSPNFDPLRVMKDYDETKANLVLCHNPDVCDLDVWNGYKGWILSGHTHGGQCRIPGVITPVLPVRNKKFISGEINLQDGRILYINRAIGHSRQVRFMVRPEITVLHLLRLKLKYYGKSKYHSYWKVCLWSVISVRKYLPFRIPVYKRLFVCFKRIFTLDLCFNTELINSSWLYLFMGF